jgi:anti-sigma regulatory factor (Ser/Thr protein kinase)
MKPSARHSSQDWPKLILSPWAALTLLAFTKVVDAQTPPSDQDMQRLVADLKSQKVWQARESSAKELARMGPPALSAIPALLAATMDNYSGVRESAAAAIGTILHGSNDDRVVGNAVKALLALGDDRTTVSSAATSAIVQIGSHALPALIGAIQSTDDTATRHFAATLLDDFPDIGVEQAKTMTTLFRDADGFVRRQAASSAAKAVENCAGREVECVRYLPQIRDVDKALSGVEDLRAQAAAVGVCRRYLELLATTANKPRPIALLEALGPFTALYGVFVTLATVVIGTFARRYREARDRLGNKILEISKANIFEEKNEIARSAIKRFVTLPPDEERPGFSIAAAFADASDVSGDFYNWFNRIDGSTCAYLVDVEGSGIDAAIQATHAARVLERALTGGDIQRAEVLLEMADRTIRKELSQPNIAVTMNLIEIYPRHVRLANAGMPAPLLFRRGQAQPHNLQAAGVYVGGGYSRFQVQPRFEETAVNEGDLLVLFSDGVLEARDKNDTIFGRPGIESAVVRERDSDPGVVARRILDAAAVHSGKGPDDDQTVLVVRFGRLNPPGIGANTLVEVSFDDAEAEFTLTNANDSAAVFDSILQTRIRTWVERLDSESPGRIWCALWEVLKNAVVHGSRRGDVISLKLRASKLDITVEVEQPIEWRKWDEYLGDVRRGKLSNYRPGNKENLPDHLGTAVMLRLAENVTASMVGRRLTLVFRREDRGKLRDDVKSL